MKREAPALAPKSALPMPDRDHIQGPINAPIALVEYGDYECPFCGEAYPIVKTIQQRLGDRLCFAFRNFPLVNSHPHAEHAAETAEAAGAQGRFWKMHDLLYENQNALEDEDLAGYAWLLAWMQSGSCARSRPARTPLASGKTFVVERAMASMGRPHFSSTVSVTTAGRMLRAFSPL